MPATSTFKDSSGHLVIAQPFPFVARVFGLLFMLPGLKLGRDFVNALVEVWRAADWRVTDILGFGFWLGMMLVFLVPGWAIATIRRRVTLDRGHRRLFQVNDFLVYRWSSSRPLSEFSAVRLFVPRPTSSRSSSRVSYHVELSSTARNHVTVFMDEQEDRARAVAEEVASFASLPLRSDLDEEVADAD